MKQIVKIPAFGDHRFKSWCKTLTSVDTTKQNGYAFTGEFLDSKRLHELAPGTIVLCYGEEGSMKYHAPAVKVCQLTAEGTWTTLFEADSLNPAWALAVRDEITKVLVSHTKAEQPAQVAPVPFDHLADEEICQELHRRGLLYRLVLHSREHVPDNDLIAELQARGYTVQPVDTKGDAE